jgi:tetratricopeptide (TPR) repeat protein
MLKLNIFHQKRALPPAQAFSKAEKDRPEARENLQDAGRILKSAKQNASAESGSIWLAFGNPKKASNDLSVAIRQFHKAFSLSPASADFVFGDYISVCILLAHADFQRGKRSRSHKELTSAIRMAENALKRDIPEATADSLQKCLIDAYLLRASCAERLLANNSFFIDVLQPAVDRAAAVKLLRSIGEIDTAARLEELNTHIIRRQTGFI